MQFVIGFYEYIIIIIIIHYSESKLPIFFAESIFKNRNIDLRSLNNTQTAFAFQCMYVHMYWLCCQAARPHDKRTDFFAFLKTCPKLRANILGRVLANQRCLCQNFRSDPHKSKMSMPKF
jgi:hypothetical protein